MVPLDDDAVAAVEARRAAQPLKVAQNGVQAIDTRTDKVKVTPFKAHNREVMP